MTVSRSCTVSRRTIVFLMTTGSDVVDVAVTLGVAVLAVPCCGEEAMEPFETDAVWPLATGRAGAQPSRPLATNHSIPEKRKIAFQRIAGEDFRHDIRQLDG